jgi:voltage-gated potassium channel
MQKDIDRLQDHFIVCGIGRVGRTVCRRLSEASVPFVVIEKDQEQFNWARSRGHLVINGAATEDEVLMQAGIERARGVVCAVDSDPENIVITLSARELNPDVSIISRADNEDAVHKIQRAGASHVVSPALKGGDDIANLLIRPHLAEFLEQSSRTESEYKLSDVAIAPGSALVGQTLREYGAREQGLVFVAIKRADGTPRLRPFAEERFRPGDIVIIAGQPDAVLRMSNEARRSAVLV